MQPHHLRHPTRSSGRHPRAREVHKLELIARQQCPSLTMRHSDHALAVPSHLILLNVLPRSLVEMLLQLFILVGHRCCIGPHRVSQAHRRTHVRCQVHGSIVPRPMDHRHGRVHFLEVQLIELFNNVSRG